MNKKGLSIVEVVVAAGIMSLIAIGISTTLTNLNKESKAIGEKILTYELQSQMRSLFDDPNYCNCAFAGKNFNMSVAPPVINNQFGSLITGFSAPSPTCTPSGGTFIPTASSQLPGSTMTIQSLGLQPLTLVSPGVYKAEMIVQFDNTVRAIKPITTSILFTVNMAGGTGPTNRPFSVCGSLAPTSAASYDSGWIASPRNVGGAYGLYYGVGNSRVVINHGLGSVPTKVDVLCQLAKNSKTIKLGNHIDVISDSKVQGVAYDSTNVYVTYENYVLAPYDGMLDPANHHFDTCSSVRAMVWL